MYDHHLYGYRKLTTNEQEIAERAMMWLLDKHLNSHDIAFLTERQLDRELKLLCVTVEKGRLIFFRRIAYAGTDFDTYLTEVLPCLKVKNWLFPNQGWTGVKPSFGFHVHQDSVENFIQNHKKKLLYYRKQYSIIEVSTKKKNIKMQNLVVRRIALRA